MSFINYIDMKREAGKLELPDEMTDDRRWLFYRGFDAGWIAAHNRCEEIQAQNKEEPTP